MSDEERRAYTPDRVEVTKEVADEGGTPGDVELEKDTGAGAGSEADETWRPIDESIRERRHDETGEGRRTP